MHSDEIRSVHAWASSSSGRNRDAVQSDYVRLVLARDSIAQDVSE